MTPRPKVVLMAISTATVATNGTVSGVMDCLGYDYAVVDVLTSTADATTSTFKKLILSEGDASNSVTAFKTDGTDFTSVRSSTNASCYAQFRVDLRGRKRWLKIEANPGTAESVTVVGTLYRADEAPTSAALANALNLVEV